MLVEVVVAFSLSIQVHPNFSKDYSLFSEHILQFLFHFSMGFHQFLGEADTPKTSRFSQFAYFLAH